MITNWEDLSLADLIALESYMDKKIALWNGMLNDPLSTPENIEGYKEDKNASIAIRETAEIYIREII